MLPVVFAAAAAYIATNIDDLFLNMLFFARADSSREKAAVYAGKYLGTALLTAASMAAAQGLSFVAEKYISYLGIIPLVLGIKELAAIFRNDFSGQETGDIPGSMLFSVAAVTVASGADNIGVYIPLFAGYSVYEFMLTTAVFAIMTGIWCAAGSAVSRLPRIKDLLVRYRKYIVPAVYIALGIYIFIR